MPLDALEPTWINAPGGVGPTYDSEELRRDIGFILAGGATADVSRTGVLDVRALTVTLSGSNVRINPGGCAIGTGKGAYLTGATVTATIDALAPADATNPRRDRVVLEVLDPDNGGGAGRKGQFRVITGTPSATATAGGGYPAAPTSPSITLAYVDVPKSGAGNPAVTDQRPYTAAEGAPIPVRDTADLATVPKFVGQLASRMDQGGAIVRYDGSTWGRVDARTNLDVALSQSDASTVNALWGPGSPAQMAAAVVAAKSSNQDRFTFPVSNQIQATDEGLYDATWTIRFYNTDGITPKASTGYLRISDNGTGLNQVHYGVTNFAAVSDVSVTATNITLAALGKLNFNFLIPDTVTAKHWIRIARKG
ncbi:hypothetical protein [Arthrobacter sp. MP_2.3]|uniref:hypothetical protein n=1 Tax=Arthrobacter sp. MP_2.3 TaxID=3349633 RepID=UPI0038D3EA10